MGTLQTEEERFSWLNPRKYLHWCPTSMSQLVQAEQKIFRCFQSIIQTKFVPVCRGENRLWTLTANAHLQRTPVILVHGMGGGIGLWAQNIDALAEKRPVYAFDLLGFGRSSRPKFSNDAMIVEREFVDSLEDWRREMNVDKFILVGHSLGGFIASSYGIKHPEHIEHLILLDPWGFPERPPDDSRRQVPMWIRAIATMLSPFNPLSGLRAAGPLGPGLVRRFRPDLQRKFSGMFDDDTIFDYIYHCNAQTPSGEIAFKALTKSFGWAKNPMVLRIADIKNDIPITMIYGSRSWIDHTSGYSVKYLRNGCYVDVQLVNGAGHHVYADRPVPVNNLILKICDIVDKKNSSNGHNSDAFKSSLRKTKSEFEFQTLDSHPVLRKNRSEVNFAIEENDSEERGEEHEQEESAPNSSEAITSEEKLASQMGIDI